jgi:transmembrane sensor
MTPLPQDIEQARRIGRHLEEGDDPTDGVSDQQTRTAIAALSERQMTVQPDAASSDRMWAAIDSEIRTSRPSARIIRLSPWHQWAAVAASLVLLLAVYALLISESEPPSYALAPGADVEDIRLADGSVARLRANSNLNTLRSSPAIHEVSLRGEATFDVPPSERTFRIRTDHGEVVVIGTTFNVRTWLDRTEVSVQSGIVGIRASGDTPEVRVAAGQIGIIVPDGATVREIEDSDRHLSWHDGIIRAVSTPFDELATELGYHFGVDVIVEPELRQQTITGVIGLMTLEESLGDLAAATGTRVERRSTDEYVLTER